MGSPGKFGGLRVLPGAETTQQTPFLVPAFLKVSCVSRCLLAWGLFTHRWFMAVLCTSFMREGRVGAPEGSV